MNYWNDPVLDQWRHANSNNIAPLWCHPVNEPTPTPTPSWYEDDGDTKNTFDSYVENSKLFQSTTQNEDDICDYYDYDPYDMEILE